jgi:hypothetical protein
MAFEIFLVAVDLALVPVYPDFFLLLVRVY